MERKSIKQMVKEKVLNKLIFLAFAPLLVAGGSAWFMILMTLDMRKALFSSRRQDQTRANVMKFKPRSDKTGRVIYHPALNKKAA